MNKLKAFILVAIVFCTTITILDIKIPQEKGNAKTIYQLIINK